VSAGRSGACRPIGCLPADRVPAGRSGVCRPIGCLPADRVLAGYCTVCEGFTRACYYIYRDTTSSSGSCNMGSCFVGGDSPRTGISPYTGGALRTMSKGTAHPVRRPSGLQPSVSHLVYRGLACTPYALPVLAWAARGGLGAGGSMGAAVARKRTHVNTRRMQTPIQARTVRVETCACVSAAAQDGCSCSCVCVRARVSGSPQLNTRKESGKLATPQLAQEQAAFCTK
jgi:hypothetical protein